jgi:hypothetical protein
LKSNPERFGYSLNHHLWSGVTPAKAGVQLWQKGKLDAGLRRHDG